MWNRTCNIKTFTYGLWDFSLEFIFWTSLLQRTSKRANGGQSCGVVPCSALGVQLMTNLWAYLLLISMVFGSWCLIKTSDIIEALGVQTVGIFLDKVTEKFSCQLLMYNSDRLLKIFVTDKFCCRLLTLKQWHHRSFR